MQNFFACIFCLFLLSGCAKLPQNSDLTQNLPQSFENTNLISTTKNEITTLLPQDTLNALFLDEDLKKLLEIALQNNRDLKIAQTRILQARSQLKSSFSTLFPTLTGEINANKSKNNLRDSYSINAGLNLSWEVDIFSKNRLAKNAKESFYFQNIENLSNTQITLLSDVATLYFTLRETQNNLILTQKNIELYKEVLNLTEFKVKSGLLDSTELFTKQDLLTKEQNLLQNSKERQEKDKNALLVLLDLKELPFCLTKPYDFTKHRPFAVQNTTASVILSRPDIKASIFALHSQIYKKESAKMAQFPVLSINASLDEILKNNLNTTDFAWQIFASLSAPLLNRTKLTQNYILENEILKESHLTLQKNLSNAKAEIENAIFILDSAKKRLENSEIQYKNAQNYLDFSQNKNLFGLNDMLDHAQNQASFNNTKKILISAKNTQNIALITLFRAFGGNMEITKDNNE